MGFNNDNDNKRIFKLDKHFNYLKAIINMCPVKQTKRKRKKLFNIYSYVERQLIVVVV